MSEQDIIDVLYMAFSVAFKLSLPLLLVSLGVGLIISIFQAATQIHEQTLTFVPKFIIVGAVLVLLAPWILTTTREFVLSLFQKLMQYM